MFRTRGDGRRRVNGLGNAGAGRGSTRPPGHSSVAVGPDPLGPVPRVSAIERSATACHRCVERDGDARRGPRPI